jgi:hypothetical protein
MSNYSSRERDTKYPWSSVSQLRMTWRMTHEGLRMRWILESAESQPTVAIHGIQQTFFDAA